MQPPVKIVLAPFALPDVASVTALRLVERGQQVHLLTSVTTRRPAPAVGHETVIRGAPLADGPLASAPLFTLSQLLPPPPRWDVVAGADLSCYVVFESALGATNTLVVHATDRREIPVATGFPSKNYTNPRFLKRHPASPDRFFTVIVEEKQVELFGRLPGQDRYSKLRGLCDANDALTVSYRDGFLLFHKVDVPGPVRGTLLFPGKLLGVKLGKDFVPQGKAIEMFPDRTVFEFDADVAGEEITVFATSKEGTFLARGPSLAGPFHLTPLEEEGKGEAVVNPSVLRTKAPMHLAVLLHAQTAKARLLTSTRAVVTPP